MSMGEGVAYHKSPGKFRTIRINMTPKQALVLRKGGAITVKMITPDGSHEVSLPEADIKKLMTKLQKGVGGRIKLNGGNIVGDFGKYIQPLSDAAIDRHIAIIPSRSLLSPRKVIFSGCEPENFKRMELALAGSRQSIGDKVARF